MKAAVMRFGLVSLVLVTLITSLPATADPADLGGDGQSDATSRLQARIDNLPYGGELKIPAGHYKLSAPIVITKPVTIMGTGLGTQLLEQSNATLFQVNNTNGVVLRDLYLGSIATSVGTSLIELKNSYHNRIDNVTMLGSYYGLHLYGALLNTIVDLRSGTNFQGFFAATSKNNTWVYAEPHTDTNGSPISANANTFVAPVLEGGVNGMSINDNNGQGSVTVTGGTIEGVSGAGLVFNKTFLPSAIVGTHFEANGTDVTINGSSNVTLDTIASLSQNAIKGDSRNIRITGGVMELLSVGAGTTGVRVENVTDCLNGNDYGGIKNNNLGSSPISGNPLVVITQIVSYCSGVGGLVP